MKSRVKIFGDPPFALVYTIKEEVIAVDLVLVRPDPLLYLKDNVIYDAKLYFKNKKLCTLLIKDIEFNICKI